MESMNNVEKTLIHISHLHQLKLVASPEPKPICHACYMPCTDQSFGCIDCHYFLHITCATTRRSINHPSHPAHTLKLEQTPPYPHGQYACDGCGVDGSSFYLRCRECSYDLHLHCAAIPQKVNHHSHHHPLILVYQNPYPSGSVCVCDLCNKYIDVDKWFYLCTSCSFGGHVGCFSPKKLEVLSAALQSPQAPPPPQRSQPQPHGASQFHDQTDPLQQLRRDMLHRQRMFASSLRMLGADANMDILGRIGL